MKRLLVYMLPFLFFGSCATYEVSILGREGYVIEKHTTPRVYVGTEAFVIDAVIDPFVMLYSLFKPIPKIESSIGVNAGMNLNLYLSRFYSLTPGFLGGANSNLPWLVFDDVDGFRYTYEGYHYKLKRNTKYIKPKKESIIID